jgi:hypothetical protein
MKRTSLIAAVTALLLSPVAGYAAEKAAEKPAEKAPPAAKPEKAAPVPKAEPAPPAPKAEAAKPASVSVAPPAEKMASADKPKRGPSRAHEDARVCLEQATNREVAICAEKFR